MITLREFKYFDRQIVEDFLSSIEGGLAKESRLSSIIKDSRIGAEAGIPCLKIKGNKGTEDISNEETKTLGDAALFQRLYDALEQNRKIRKYSELERTPERAKGELFEIEGDIKLPFFASIFEVTRQLSPLGAPQVSNSNGNNFFDLLAQSQTVNVRLVCQESKFGLACIIQKRNLRVPMSELSDEYTGLYRVKKVLRLKETYDIFKLPIPLNPAIINNFLSNSNNMSTETLEALGINQLSQDDLQIRHPAFILTPIAIYQ